MVAGIATGLAVTVGASLLAARCEANAPIAPARRKFPTVGAMLASRAAPLGRGSRYWAGEYRYVEAAADARIFDVRTQGGAKLMIEQTSELWPVAAFGAAAGARDARAQELADASGAISAALRRIAEAGGGTLAFDAGKTYRVDETIVIRNSGVKLMGAGARLVGAGRFVARGGNGRGGSGGLITGFSMTGFLMSERFRGPVLQYCRQYELGHLARDNTAGTWINVHYCRDGRIHDCVARNGERTKIAFLVLGGENNLGERCRVTGGEWVYAFQIKGGRNNWFRDCSIENVRRMKHGFRIRGDAPWHASRTPGAYPFAEGSWDRPDPRRATRESGYSDCVVRNSVGVHFLATEFTDCAFLRCASHGAGASHRPINALVAFRQPGGHEGNLRVAEFYSAGARDIAVFVRGEKGGKALAGLLIDRATILGAGKHGLACENCDAPQIVSARVAGCGADGIRLIDCPGWRANAPEVTQCRRGFHAARTMTSTGALPPGSLDDARRLDGNRTDLACTVPYSLGRGGDALSIATADTRAVSFPQVFTEPGTRAWRIDVTFETILDGVASSFRESFAFRSRKGAIELLGADLASGVIARRVGSGRIIFAGTGDKIRIRIAPGSAQPMRHRIVAIESEALSG